MFRNLSYGTKIGKNEKKIQVTFLLCYILQITKFLDISNTTIWFEQCLSSIVYEK